MTDEVKQVLHVYDGDGGVIIRENGNISTFGKQSVAVDQAFAALSGTREAVEPVAFTVPYTLELLRQGRGTTAPLCPTKAPDYHPLCTVPLFAAPPSDPVGQGAVTVKPLEWSGRENAFPHEAETPFGKYLAFEHQFCGPSTHIGLGTRTLDEAKAAAQADYEARILSTLSDAAEGGQ